MSNQDQWEQIRSLKKSIAQQTGLEEGYDAYFFLARLGSNYDQYSFSWEPFRDLAGPLGAGPNARPILVLSDKEDRAIPEVTQHELPAPHFQFRVSPSCSATSVANRWLELLVDDDASHRRYHGSFRWFPAGLHLNPSDLTEKSRRFLML